MLQVFALGLFSQQAFGQQRQQYHVAPRIDGFNVDEVRALAPGTELNFSLYGTPGGIATLRIAGAKRNVTLSEVDAGQYEGAYTISSHDNITPQSSVTANLRLGNQVATSVLSESLQAGVGYHPPDQVGGPLPKIDRFEAQPSANLGGGSEVSFTLHGTPGGRAEIGIAGAEGKFLLPETRPGEYTGVYTIKRRDHITPDSAVTADLRVGDRVTSASLGRPLQASAPAARNARRPDICQSCGTVEAVNAVEVKGNGNYLGTIGGGVVGALLGSQVGNGSGRTAAQIAGAVGGAVAGREIERNAKKALHYEVVVRLQNGGTQIVSFENNPGYRVGERVRIVDGTLTRG